MNGIKTRMINVKQCLMLLLFVLGISAPQIVQAKEYRGGSICSYTVNSKKFIKFEFDQNTFNYINTLSSVPGGSFTVTVKVYDGNPSPTYPPAGPLLGTVNGVQFGPVFTADITGMNLSSPTGTYYIVTIVDFYIYGVFSTSFDLMTAVSKTPCDLTPDPNSIKEACYSVHDNGASVLKVTVDPALLLYGTANGYNASSSNLPVAYLTSGPLGYTFIGPFMPISVNSTTSTILYDISSASLDGTSCYDLELRYYEPNNVTSRYWLPQDNYVCPCKTPVTVGCDAKFSTSIRDAGNASFFLDIDPVVGNVTLNETLKVMQGSTVVYNGLPTILMLPNGTYTICRTVTAEDGSTCEWCADVCYSGGGIINPPRDGKLKSAADEMGVEFPGGPCSAEFTSSTLDNGGNTFVVQIVSVDPANVSSETMKITQGGVVLYDGLMVGIILPNGTYTICHKVTANNGSQCEWCADICFTGNASDNIPDGKERKSVITHKKTLTDSKATVIKNGNELRIDFFAGEQGKVDYAIYNSMGQIVVSKQGVSVQKGTNKFTATGSALSTGIYYLKVVGSNMSTTSKFFVD